MNIHQRINALTGEYVDGYAIVSIVQEAARDVVSQLPPNVLTPMYSEITDSGSGVSVSEKRIITAHKAGYEATRYRGIFSTRLADDATDEKSPVYYVDGTTAYVLPGGGTIVTVAVPAITAAIVNGQSISGVPTHILNMIIIRAAFLAMDFLMAKKHLNVTLAVTMPTAPSAPPAPVIDYSDAAAVAPSAVSLDALPSVPSFVEPTFGGDITLPTISTLDLTKDIDANSITIPAAPAVPAFNYVGPVASSISQTTIAALSAAPEYNPVIPTLDFTDWETAQTNDDTELMSEELKKISADLRAIDQSLTDSQGEFNSNLESYRGDVQKKLAQAQLDQDRLVEGARLADNLALQNEFNRAKIDLETYSGKLGQYNADLESYNRKISVVIEKWKSDFDRVFRAWVEEQGLHLQKYRSEVEAAGIGFGAEMQNYKSGVDRLITKAQIARSEAEQTAAQSTQISTINKAKSFEAQISAAELTLRKHSSDVEQYLSQVEGQVKRIEAENAAMAGKLRMMQFDKNRITQEYNEAAANLFGFYSSYAKNQSVFMHEY